MKQEKEYGFKKTDFWPIIFEKLNFQPRSLSGSVKGGFIRFAIAKICGN